MAVSTRSSCALLSADPLGSVSPVAKSDSDIRPPCIVRPRWTGWRCIGFHSGRDSMSAASGDQT